MMTLNRKSISSSGKFVRKVFFGLSFFSFSTVFAQNATLPAVPESAEPKPKKEMSVGLNVGVVNGIGIDLSYKFAKHWAGRIAYNYANYTKNDYVYDIVSTNPDGTKNTQKVSFDAGVKFSNVAMNVEFMPGEKGRFKLIGGLSVFPSNKIIASGEMISTFKFNDMQLNPEDLGSGIGTIGFKSKVSPFLGMGFGRTFPRKRVNVSMDLGAYYKGNYAVDIDVTPGALLEENESNAAILERNLNAKFVHKVFPVLNFRLAYRL
ncbi:MAG: hypothetical protein JNL70_00465 [Saprospiraceae bacterium]|nr:hypothetical protein [Saprospiraceae bacterium]